MQNHNHINYISLDMVREAKDKGLDYVEIECGCGGKYKITFEEIRNYIKEREKNDGPNIENK